VTILPQLGPHLAVRLDRTGTTQFFAGVNAGFFQ